MTDEDDDLAERVGDLEAAIEDLRDELREPASGPFGLPRPPTPGEVLRFTDEYALPTMIAVLEANLRALKLLQRVLRATRGVEDSDARDRARDLGRDTVARIDDALSDLSAAMEDSDLPREPEARRLLEDVRELNEEIRDSLETGGSYELGGKETEEEDDDERDRTGSGTDSRTEIDVDAELESIKDEVRGNDAGGTGGDGSVENPDEGPDPADASGN